MRVGGIAAPHNVSAARDEVEFRNSFNCGRLCSKIVVAACKSRRVGRVWGARPETSTFDVSPKQQSHTSQVRGRVKPSAARKVERLYANPKPIIRWKQSRLVVTQGCASEIVGVFDCAAATDVSAAYTNVRVQRRASQTPETASKRWARTRDLRLQNNKVLDTVSYMGKGRDAVISSLRRKILRPRSKEQWRDLELL
jgi:hypothetical protein